MTHQSISTYISKLTVSLLLLMMAQSLSAQKHIKAEKDSIAFFRGFAVSFDLVGPARIMLSDYGEYEGALRINLHDQWFPIFEVGVGHAKHNKDDITGL